MNVYVPAFVIWGKQELQAFVSIFKRQVFESKASLTTIADCVVLAKSHCEEVGHFTKIVLAITFTLSRFFIGSGHKELSGDYDWVSC